MHDIEFDPLLTHINTQHIVLQWFPFNMEIIVIMLFGITIISCFTDINFHFGSNINFLGSVP